jgi:hypothetical protein
MRVQILHVPDCPNAAPLSERLAQVLAGRSDVHIKDHVVTDQDQASALGMYGSPTVLVDGVDPFAGPGQSASVACRLYRGEDGSLSGAPTLAQLRDAIPGNCAGHG